MRLAKKGGNGGGARRRPEDRVVVAARRCASAAGSGRAVMVAGVVRVPREWTGNTSIANRDAATAMPIADPLNKMARPRTAAAMEDVDSVHLGRATAKRVIKSAADGLVSNAAASAADGLVSSAAASVADGLVSSEDLGARACKESEGEDLDHLGRVEAECTLRFPAVAARWGRECVVGLVPEARLGITADLI